MFSTIKKILCIALSLFIICSTPLSSFALTNETRSTNLSYPKLHNSAGPTVNGLKAYVDIDEFREHLISGFSTCPDSLDISKFRIPYSSVNASLIASYIWYETPELFHVLGLGVSYRSGYITAVNASYDYTASEYATMLNKFEHNSNKLLEGIKGNDNLTDVEKALLIHDRVAIWCEYDYERLNNGTMPQISYSAYGAIVNKFAVCMGYALAYDYLLFQVGIDSEYCSSDLLNHAWNIVHVNNSTYHVDVTWDDPVCDRSGRVLHENFLRSTTGMVETGHVKNNSIDYSSAPVDTTFDNYYWQNSNTAFQLIGDDIYFIDNDTSALKRIRNSSITTCKTVSDTWKASASSYWVGNFACLSSDGEKLFYSLSKSVYEFDPKTNTAKTVFSPDLSGGSYYSIYGFKFENCQFICEVFNTPDFTETTKALNTKRLTNHKTGDWILDYGASPYEEGYKHKECTVCGAYLEDTVIPMISIEQTENSEIDYHLALLFTDNLLCNDINELVFAFDSTTVDVDNSNGFIGTGAKINVSNDGEEVSYLTVIVSGDVNGDGICNVLDAGEVERFSTGAKEPTEIEIHAANGEYSSEITSATFQTVLNKALAS